MFRDAVSFNQDISDWSFGYDLSMAFMFYKAKSFNQDLKKWNFQKVRNFDNMFFGASSFNQNVGSWELKPLSRIRTMLDSSGLDCDNYTATLFAWSRSEINPLEKNITLNVGGLQYGTRALVARELLVKSAGWTIIGDRPSSADCGLLLPPTGLSFYPNPTKGRLYFPDLYGASYHVFDVSGKLFLEGKITSASLSIEELSSGMYFIKIITPDLSFTQKVWKY